MLTEQAEELAAYIESLDSGSGDAKIIRGLLQQNTRLREALVYALWQYEGNGTPEHGHWSGKAKQALAETKV